MAKRRSLAAYHYLTKKGVQKLKKLPEFVYDFEKLPELVTVSEAALAMRASESFIREAYNRGDLEIFDCGSTIRISRKALIDFKNRYTVRRSTAKRTEVKAS